MPTTHATTLARFKKKTREKLVLFRALHLADPARLLDSVAVLYGIFRGHPHLPEGWIDIQLEHLRAIRDLLLEVEEDDEN